MSDDDRNHDANGSSAVWEPHTRVAGTPYQVVGLLGAGGMSVVYEVRHLDTGEHYALKVLSSHLAKLPVFVERFLREIQAMSALLGQPHLVRFVGSGLLPNRQPFCVMELLKGETLRQRLRFGALSVPQAISCTVQLLSGLAAVHGAGVVHRDVKPDNLFIQANGFCKLLDFGVIKVLVEGGPINGKTVLTAPGTLVGTTHYIAPEHAAFKTPDHRADIYAAGVILFESLCGRVPFSELSKDDYLARVLEKGFPSLDDVGAGHIPASIRRVVRVATYTSPDDRYASAAEFIAKLIEAAMCEGIPILTPKHGPADEKARASSRVVVMTRRPVARTLVDSAPLADTEPLSPRSLRGLSRPTATSTKANASTKTATASSMGPPHSAEVSPQPPPASTPAAPEPSGQRSRFSLLALMGQSSGTRQRPPRAPWTDEPLSSNRSGAQHHTPSPSPIRAERETPALAPRPEHVTLASELPPRRSQSAHDSHPAIESPRVRLVAPFTGRSGRASRRAALALLAVGLSLGSLLLRWRSTLTDGLLAARAWKAAPSAAASVPAAGPTKAEANEAPVATGALPSSSQSPTPPKTRLPAGRGEPPSPSEAAESRSRSSRDTPRDRAVKGGASRPPKAAPTVDGAHDFRPGIEPGL